ncbi:hypothetical protein [Flavobacterium flavigenum]|uniref:hypothetical protein n=1 Tax=Flavobacterium flavigenum TaxID=3003258 RepID=UPI002482C590|nr:hypothetical protein [Flavobacterium flavigenum]
MIYTKELNELDSSESYFKIILCNKNVVVIAFVNLGISNHELNKESRLKHIDRSYIICYSVDFLKINNKILFDSGINSESYYFGGYNIDNNNDVQDIEIKTSHLILKLCDDSKIEASYFIPIDTPNIKANMSLLDLNNFWNNG